MDNNQIIVGIGASAGGLEAINELFDHLPNDTGMAFVVIQHLSPDYKSIMDELLAKHTDMPITVVKANTPVKPDNIYLIDTTSNLIIEKNVLKTALRDRNSPLNLPIDSFFHSLGSNNSFNAVGIILSGTGSDGSRGIRTLKEANGLIFAQLPASARFDGMPQMAIDTGLVDNVLTPKQIAEALTQLSQLGKNLSPMLLDMEDEAVEAMVRELLEEIHEKQGPNFHTYRRSTILRRIEKRMFLNHIEELREYVDFVMERPQELKALAQDFLISVTRFFRDPEAFAILQKKVIPELFKEKAVNDVVRIWVVGCATGEEAYTLSMLIDDYLEKEGSRRNYKIFASDLDANAIYKAGLGIYPPQISEDVSPPFLNTYFEKRPDGCYKIVKRIRETIVFTIHDVLHDPPFINMDLLTCRNLLIYLNPEAQQRLFRSFLFALRYQGYIFIGPSESLGKLKSSFKDVNKHWNIYRSNVEVKSSFNFLPLSASTRPKPITKPALPIKPAFEIEGKDGIPLKRNSTDSYVKLLLRRYVPMSLIVDDELNVLHAHGDLDQLLRFPNSPSMFNLENMVGLEELLVFKNGIRKVADSGTPTRFENVVFNKNKEGKYVDVRFEVANIPLQENPHYLIELTIKDDLDIAGAKEGMEVSTYSTLHKEQLRLMQEELHRFEEERKKLEEYLETMNEELQSANEELSATNEELQSTNEEMQSVNEELHTVNAELQSKVNELVVANSDLDNLLRATDIGTIFIDSNLRIRKFTPSIAQQFQLLESDIGRPIISFSSFLEGVNFEEALSQVLHDGKIIEREVKDKDSNFYLMRLAPYYMGSEPMGVVATFVNILTVRNVGTEVNILAKQFEAIFNSTDRIVCVLNPDGTLLDLNIVPEGYHREDIIGTNFFKDVIPKEVRGVAKAAFDKSIGTDTMVDYDIEVLMPDGKVHFYRNSMIPISRNGEIQRVICSSQDMTAEVEVAEKIRLEAAIFSNVFLHAREHILIMDPQGIILDVNFTEAGYSKEELIGKSIWQISPPERQAVVMNEVNKVINMHSHTAYEADFVDAEGKRRWYQNIFSPVMKDGKLERIVLITRDITDTKMVELGLKQTNEVLEARINERGAQIELKNKELENINSFMDSFVHGAAHDLRSPLLNIKGYVELMPEVSDPEELKSIYQDLSMSAVSMERILAGLVELIDFQRSEGPKPKLLNLKQIFLRTLDDLQPQLQQSKGTVAYDLPDNLNINYIEAYLQSIVYNLLHNAIKYRSHQRPLEVSVSARQEADGTVLFSVKDNGMGMDLRRYGHFLFKPFRRLTVEREGTGVGLSIINNVVNKNGGRIEVESELEKGSAFHVYIKPYNTN